MAALAEGFREVTPYDVFVDIKWLFLIVGFALLDTAYYTIYRMLLLLFNLYILCMSSYAMYLVMPDKNQAIEAFHVFLGPIWLSWCFMGRMLNTSWLKEMREMTNAGIYNYRYEKLDEEQIGMHSSVKEDVRRKSRMIISIYVTGIISVFLFFPLSEYLMNNDDSKNDERLVSSYLPHFYYVPFDTRTPGGYAAAYIQDLLFWVIIYVTAVSTNGIVISSTVQLKVQFRVLNYSLRNIEKRAYFIYTKRRDISHDRASMVDLLKDEEFQKCLNVCLKANVEHHLALLRFHRICKPFNGYCILNVFTITTIIYAATLYSMFQNPPINVLVNYIGTFVAEQTYSYFICYFGEEVKEESIQLFESLYSTPWFNYNKSFKQTLHIMMSNSMKPLVIGAHLLDFSATLESYGELLAAVYKVMNIWRQSENL